jgi:ketosteroid isomerase-like protein
MRIRNVAGLAACVALAAVVSSDAQTKGLSAAEQAKNKELTEAFSKAVVAKDYAAVAAIYAEDAVLNPPNEPAVKGRAAIRAWMEKLPPVTEFKAQFVQLEGRDDMAYVLATYTMTLAPPGAPAPVKDSGKYVEIRRRQPGGRWIVTVDIFNSDLPAPPPH